MNRLDTKRINLLDFSSFECEAVSLTENMCTVEDDDNNADFFTVYGRLDDGLAVALVDCCTRQDAEQVTHLLNSALNLLR